MRGGGGTYHAQTHKNRQTAKRINTTTIPGMCQITMTIKKKQQHSICLSSIAEI